MVGFCSNDRCTSIRSNYFKYIIRPDSNEEEFYDLQEDSFEENNIISIDSYKSNINDFREYYKKTEHDAIEFQTKYLISKLLRKSNIGLFNTDQKKVLLLANE